MQKKLVIVESPAKAKTIERFLGEGYTVLSSKGHIRDLKEKDFSIDLDNNYKPLYEVPAEKKELVANLKKASDKADVVWLATDEDREGEAIAWHLYEVLGLNEAKTRRIVFHEITKTAIQKAIENPRTINLNLVNAQQARRVLDRIVGFELSPILWKKIKPALSAGRVQSVTVRLVVEREREINNFKTEASYRVTALFNVTDTTGKNVKLKSELNKRFATKEEARAFLEKCNGTDFVVEQIETKPTKQKPAPPFTTSTLQQEAARKFSFPVGLTMRIAQKLYEAGKITYMRTDSVNLSDLALSTAKQEIITIAGEKYHTFRQYHTKSKGAQEAHEAIRPTDINQHTIEGSQQEKKLYELIWKRTIASQMSDAELEKTVISIKISDCTEKFISTGETIKFDGFLKVYLESTDDEQEQKSKEMLPKLSVGQPLELLIAEAQERFTQHPPRYTEASLVRKLEELGIGRPSTYAPTISTILNREYVDKKEIENPPTAYDLLTLKNGKIKEVRKEDKATVDKGKLSPTSIGFVVNDFLIEHFPDIMDYNFTAKVETDFDEIAEGKIEWTKSIDQFYKKFHPNVTEALENTGKKTGERQLGIDPKSGKPVFVKIGRFGAIAQIGEKSSEEKPRFASLRSNQTLETITLEEALDLFKLPMDLGEFENETMTVAVGRFGPYVRHGKVFVSLPKDEDPLEMTLEKAIQLIKGKRTADANRQIKSFPAEDIFILNGQFGAYIAHNGKNYKIPKGKTPADLSVEECLQIIGDCEKIKTQKTSGKRSPRKATTKK
ncbi:MAG TPA: type I DNA topoisomerase [Paludibacteraceae bacterium]|nr:type I DNA topoisomerase [Paludibacteraceae bacterium]